MGGSHISIPPQNYIRKAKKERKRPHCSFCRNHSKMVSTCQHHCDYKLKCDCILCQLTKKAQIIMCHQQRVWRHNNLKLGEKIKQTKGQKCDNCRNHMILEKKSNHDCRFKDCNCPYCKLTYKRREIMKHIQRARRLNVTWKSNIPEECPEFTGRNVREKEVLNKELSSLCKDKEVDRLMQETTPNTMDCPSPPPSTSPISSEQKQLSPMEFSSFSASSQSSFKDMKIESEFKKSPKEEKRQKASISDLGGFKRSPSAHAYSEDKFRERHMSQQPQHQHHHHHHQQQQQQQQQQPQQQQQQQQHQQQQQQQQHQHFKAPTSPKEEKPAAVSQGCMSCPSTCSPQDQMQTPFSYDEDSKPIIFGSSLLNPVCHPEGGRFPVMNSNDSHHSSEVRYHNALNDLQSLPLHNPYSSLDWRMYSHPSSFGYPPRIEPPQTRQHGRPPVIRPQPMIPCSLLFSPFLHRSSMQGFLARSLLDLNYSQNAHQLNSDYLRSIQSRAPGTPYHVKVRSD